MSRLDRHERCRRLGSGQLDLGRPRPEVIDAGDELFYSPVTLQRSLRGRLVKTGPFTACLLTPTKQDGCEWLNA
jgi:hypothetical protein